MGVVGVGVALGAAEEIEQNAFYAIKFDLLANAGRRIATFRRIMSLSDEGYFEALKCSDYSLFQSVQTAQWPAKRTTVSPSSLAPPSDILR